MIPKNIDLWQMGGTFKRKSKRMLECQVKFILLMFNKDKYKEFPSHQKTNATSRSWRIPSLAPTQEAQFKVLK